MYGYFLFLPVFQIKKDWGLMQKKTSQHTPTWRVFSTSSSLIAADNWPVETTSLHQRYCVSNRNIQTTGETHTTRHNEIDKATQGRKRTQFEWRREMNVKMGFGEILNLHILIGKSMLCTNREKGETASPALQNLSSGCLHLSLSQKQFSWLVWTTTELFFEDSSPLVVHRDLNHCRDFTVNVISF